MSRCRKIWWQFPREISFLFSGFNFGSSIWVASWRRMFQDAWLLSTSASQTNCTTLDSLVCFHCAVLKRRSFKSKTIIHQKNAILQGKCLQAVQKIGTAGVYLILKIPLLSRRLFWLAWKHSIHVLHKMRKTKSRFICNTRTGVAFVCWNHLLFWQLKKYKFHLGAKATRPRLRLPNSGAPIRY